MKPLFTKILVTANTYTEEECVSENGLLEKDQVGMLKEVQEVISVGSSVKEFKPGDLVQINFSRYARKRYSKDETKADMPDEYFNETISYEIPMFEVNGELVLQVDVQDVLFVVEEFEVETTDVKVQATKKTVLVS